MDLCWLKLIEAIEHKQSIYDIIYLTNLNLKQSLKIMHFGSVRFEKEQAEI